MTKLLGRQVSQVQSKGDVGEFSAQR
jgi:hypothetical protein